MPVHPDSLDWNDVPILLALARAGTMRKACVRLGVDASTISRRVAAAESRLETRLFIRSPTGYKPTDVGRVFLEAAQAIEDQMRSLVSATQTESDTVSGPVRITSVDTLLNDWVIPRLPALLEAHPHLQIKMIPDNHALSFGRSEADLALRIARPREDAAVLMRRVGAIGMAVYGARTFKATPRERWGELPWLAFNDDLADVPEMKWLQRIVPGAKVRFRCSSMSSLLQACEAGIGIAMLPYFAVRSKTLVRLSSAPEIQREIWLLRHRDASKIRRFRVVAEWIASIAETDRAKLLGQG